MYLIRRVESLREKHPPICRSQIDEACCNRKLIFADHSQDPVESVSQGITALRLGALVLVLRAQFFLNLSECLSLSASPSQIIVYAWVNEIARTADVRTDAYEGQMRDRADQPNRQLPSSEHPESSVEQGEGSCSSS